jgi:hypothetical protein
MRCLLLAAELGLTVPDRCVDGLYTCLLAGREYVKRSRFAFDETSVLELPPLSSAHPPRKRRRLVHVLENRIDIADVDGLDGSGVEDSGSDSSSAGFSSGSSSSSSSAVLGEHTTGPSIGGPCAGSSVGGPSISSSGGDGVSGVGDVHGGRALGSSGGRALDSTFIRKSHFKFCEIKSQGAPVGWEIQCGIHNLAGETTRCTRTLRWAAHGGRDITERKLKHGAMQAFGFEAEDRCGHMSRTLFPKTRWDRCQNLASWMHLNRQHEMLSVACE